MEIRADKYYVVAIQKKVWWETNIAANRLSSSNSLEHNHITLFAKGLLVVLLDRRRLQYSSQIVETGAICLEFSPDFLHSLFTPLFSLKCALLLPQCWAERILKRWNDCKAKSTLGRGKSHKCFKNCDEYCRSKEWQEMAGNWDSAKCFVKNKPHDSVASLFNN